MPLNDEMAPITTTFEKDKHILRFRPDTTGSTVWRQFKDSTGVKKEEVVGTLILTNRWNEKDTISNFKGAQGEKLFKLTWFNTTHLWWLTTFSMSKIDEDNTLVLKLGDLRDKMGLDNDLMKNCRYEIVENYGPNGT